MNIVDIILLIVSLALGIFAGFINSLISKKAMQKNEMTSAIGVNAIRFVVDILSLVIVFAICKLAGASFVVPLLACAIGVTVGGMLFLTRLTRKINAETNLSQKIKNISEEEK